MYFIDFNRRKKVQIWEGITGSLYHSEKATFGHLTLEKGILLPQHRHEHEQWSHVIEGQLEFTVNDETQVLSAGMAAYIPSWAPHSAKALTACKVIDCFMPFRQDFKDLEQKSM